MIQQQKTQKKFKKGKLLLMLVCNLASEVFTSGIVIDTGTASSRVPGEPLFSWEDVACDLPRNFCQFNQVSGDCQFHHLLRGKRKKSKVPSSS